MVAVRKTKRSRTHTFIKAWREFRDLTQERVSERIGISRENYGRIESGKVPYNQDFLELCAVALNCSTSDLLSRDPNTDSLIDQLHTLLSKSSANEQKRVLAVAKTLIENKG